jgi:hypothetical protein
VILAKAGYSDDVLTKPNEAMKPADLMERQFSSSSKFIDSNKNKGNAAITKEKKT